MANLPYIGMPADEVLKMKGRGNDNILVWPSRILGEDDNGLIVEWEYPDIKLIMKRWNGRYRVAEIVQNVEGAGDVRGQDQADC